MSAALLVATEGCGPPAAVYGPPPQEPEAPAEPEAKPTDEPGNQPAEESESGAKPEEGEAAIPMGGATGMYGPPPGS